MKKAITLFIILGYFLINGQNTNIKGLTTQEIKQLTNNLKVIKENSRDNQGFELEHWDKSQNKMRVFTLNTQNQLVEIKKPLTDEQINNGDWEDATKDTQTQYINPTKSAETQYKANDGDTVKHSQTQYIDTSKDSETQNEVNDKETYSSKKILIIVSAILGFLFLIYFVVKFFKNIEKRTYRQGQKNEENITRNENNDIKQLSPNELEDYYKKYMPK
jgi:predicted PurR-regulated permease PerM